MGTKSGLWRGQRAAWGTSSNDKPDFGFGLQGMDDYSIHKVIHAVAPLVPRNYIIMEVKANLLKDRRSKALKKFNAPCYKKVAHVVMGEPNNDWKEHVQETMLET